MADADPVTKPSDVTAQQHEDAAGAARLQARKTWLKRLALAIAAAALLFALWYLLIGRNHVSTDNAYVNAEVAQVTPLLSAQVLSVAVSDTQPVRRGDILVRLDDSNSRIAYAQAEAELARARRMFRQASATSSSLSAQVEARRADIASAEAKLATARADYDKARIDLDRRLELQPSGAVSGEELSSARKAFAAARANLDVARAGIAQAQSSRGAASGELAANQALVSGSTIETDPMVLAAKAKLEAAKLDLDRAVIRAPIDGIVARRQVQVGQRVAQGSSIMTIVPLSKVYVEANFKERQLRRVKAGQPATLTADIYGGDVEYHGRVVGFSGGTGSAFALIPAQNATGNWIKVVQRVPVRIQLDPKELAAHPLRVGLSMEAEVDVSGN
ncbi:HlyD family secretion protein [Rhizorhabdus argentea]|uniref:HlyD family secretion protein n=1 Tax=Rhizorhabdus argentea TaxID=1387174 RepID=UPI0030EF7209